MPVLAGHWETFIYIRVRGTAKLCWLLCASAFFLLEVRAVVGDISLLFDEAKSLI